MIGTRCRSPTLPHPAKGPIAVGFEGFEGGERGVRSQTICAEPMWLNVSAATFRYTRGPAVRTTTQVSPKLSGSEQPSSIISLMVWARGAVEQPTITVNMAAQVFDDVVNKFCP